MLELELTFLLQSFPPAFVEEVQTGNYQNIKSKKEIFDCYFPSSLDHPRIRLRKNGETFELTKKVALSTTDASIQEEQTLVLTAEEYQFFAQLEGKKIHKTRYRYEYLPGKFAEIDVFHWALSWLVLVDFEFQDLAQKDNFSKPERCWWDITQDATIAWGILAGKSYQDILPLIQMYDYTPLFLT